MEGFRSFGVAGEEARCGIANCSATADLYTSRASCANQDDLPSNVIANTNKMGLEFVEKACCSPGAKSAPFGEGEPDQCAVDSLAKFLGLDDDSEMNLPAIIGGSVAAGVALLLLGMAIAYRRKAPAQTPPVAEAKIVQEQHVEVPVKNLEVMEAPASSNPAASAPGDLDC